ncbi:hypothetical protein J6590_085087 [Homalodisca vitripennis]|nr:hypothetical protein J6590_085087 [Homalodisca vitripennis]
MYGVLLLDSKTFGCPGLIHLFYCAWEGCQLEVDKGRTRHTKGILIVSSVSQLNELDSRFQERQRHIPDAALWKEGGLELNSTFSLTQNPYQHS